MFIAATVMCLPSSAVIVGAWPAKGTWTRRVPMRRSKPSISRWSSEPMPAVPTATLSGLARA